MDTIVALHNKLEVLPPNMIEEAFTYIDCLIEKSKRNTQTQRKFGSAKGKIHMSEDFDEPLTDYFKDYV